MTLPTIKFEKVDHPAGKIYAATFTPEGMINQVRLYGETLDEARDLAWNFLEEHDKELRKQQREDKMKTYKNQDYLDGYGHGFDDGRSTYKDLSTPSLWIGIGIGICCSLAIVGIVALIR